MRKNEPITGIMTANPVHVEQGEKLSRVRRLLTEHHIHHLPVTHAGKLVGIVSSTDVFKISVEAYGTDPRAVDQMLDHQFTLKDVMQPNPSVMHTKDTVRRAAELLSSGKFHSVPVVDADNRLAGIVTSTDLIRYVLSQY